MNEHEQLFEIKADGPVVIITLWNQGFGNFAKAIAACADKFGDRKILLMQSIKKDTEPMKIIIVFQF